MKIGFISLPLTGHLNPMTALARKLQQRGHEVVFFGLLDSERIIRAAGLPFVPICEQEFPLGRTERDYTELASLRGMEHFRYNLTQIHPPRLKAVLADLPTQLGEADVSALVIDKVFRMVELIALRYKLPYVQVWNVLHLDPSGNTPPWFSTAPYDATSEQHAHNLDELAQAASYGSLIREIAKKYAAEHRIDVDWSLPDPTASRLAVVSQTPLEFDYPGIPWPLEFHYCGPFSDDRGREVIEFPWDRLTGVPLIYASMGTLVKGIEPVLRAIVGIAESLPEVQIVLSVGAVSQAALGDIPSNVIVVARAPQPELLERASLCITHAGLNTTLESLAAGVPLLAIPIAFDQPGIASRIRYHKVGDFIEESETAPERLLSLVKLVLRDPLYRENAKRLQKVLLETRGLDQAAEVIHRVLDPSEPRSGSHQIAIGCSQTRETL